MMQSLEGACEEGERAIKKLKLGITSLPLPRPQQEFNLTTKFYELYKEETTAKEHNEHKIGLKTDSNLLEKLANRERLNTLILNLYPDNKGYTLILRRLPNDPDDNIQFETRAMPYEEDELLRYIDNQEIPPYLMDTLENEYNFLFYDGCIIIEIRNYRHNYRHSKCDINHVLLRPTSKNHLTDINNLIEKHPDLSNPSDKLELESRILLANHPTLCLTTTPTVHVTQTATNHARQRWTTPTCRRYARKFTQTITNVNRRLHQTTYHRDGELFNAIRARRRTDESRKIMPIPVPRLDPPADLAPPTQGVSINEFKPTQQPEDSSDCLPQLIEQYVMETDMPSRERGKSRTYHIRLSILQRPLNSEYLGELYLDRDYKENERNGVACRFTLGSRVDAKRYVQQFTDIFTESGRKAVRIKCYPCLSYKKRLALTQQQHSQFLLSQAQGNQTIVNGTVPRINLQQLSTATLSTANLQSISSSQSKNSGQLSNQELEINELEKKLMNSAQQSQAAANAKQQQQQKLIAANRNNAAIINLLNSSHVNSLNNSELVMTQTSNQKLLARKMTLSNVTNARLLNHNNLLSLTTATTPTNNNNNNSGKSALLVGTPSGDGTITSSLLLEKLGNLQKSSTLVAPPSSASTSSTSTPASSSSSTTAQIGSISGLNLAQIQSISGLQNVQVQLSPISFPLNVSASTGNVQTHAASLLVSLPVATSTTSTCLATPNAGSMAPTVVLANAAPQNIAQLVTSSVRGVNQTTGQSLQLVAPRLHHAAGSVQKMPITIKMAPAASNNANANQDESKPIQHYRNPQKKKFYGLGMKTRMEKQ